MPAARRGRKIAAIAVSATAHLVALAIVASQAPMLRIPAEGPSKPEPIIPVLLAPRLPSGPTAKPQPLRLHRRQPRVPLPPVPPIPAPPSEPQHAPGPGAVALHPAPLPEGPVSELRQSLRQGPIGCANPDAVGLTKAERQVCDEALGRGAKVAPFPGLGLAREKQNDFDRAAARKEADRRYREQQIAPGPAPPGGSSGQPWAVPGDPRR